MNSSGFAALEVQILVFIFNVYPYFMYASSEGSAEAAQLLLVGVISTKISSAGYSLLSTGPTQGDLSQHD